MAMRRRRVPLAGDCEKNDMPAERRGRIGWLSRQGTLT